ncbi:MAG: hypothetical protein IJC48_10845 [Clostridia bacterium]|nr:hypothetical protein [Clostridia bacterium]
MKNAREICTCTDTGCPNHPVNHEDGCTKCIIKNMREREIPSCFFHMLDIGDEQHGYSFEEFARMVMIETARKNAGGENIG